MTTSPPQAAAILVRGLRKTFPRGARALDGLDLTVPAGGVHGLLGPNGSGKSTTLRTLVGLLRADGGTMRILDREVPDELTAVIDRVGVIIEEPRFFPTMSARTNLRLLGDAIGAPRERVASALDQVGLTPHAGVTVRALSLGMKQRLAIASTLLKDPDVFIFDEPTNGLDPAGIHAVRATIRTLADAGRTVLVSSHNLAEVQQMADTVSIIARGRLLHEGPVSGLIRGGARVRVRLGSGWEDGATAQRGVTALEQAGYTVQADGDALYVSHAGRAVDPSAVARELGRVDVWPSELGSESATLEDAFLALTDGAGLDRPEGSAA